MSSPTGLRNLGGLYQQKKKSDNTKLDSKQGRRLKLGDTHPHTQESVKTLIDLYEAWGKPGEAQKWRSKLSGRADSE